MIGVLLEYLIRNVLSVLNGFYMSIGFRWLVFGLVFFLNFVAFYQNPVLYSEDRKCFGLPCKWFSFITGMGAMTLYSFGLITLWYVAPFSSIFPDYWYIPVVLITYAIIIQMTISAKVVKDSNEFVAPPEFLLPKTDRIRLYYLILVLDIIYFHQLYLDGGKQLINNPRVLDDLILGRFGGWTENKFAFLVGWFGLVGLLFDALAIRFVSSFTACNYGLPDNWNY